MIADFNAAKQEHEDEEGFHRFRQAEQSTIEAFSLGPIVTEENKPALWPICLLPFSLIQNTARQRFRCAGRTLKRSPGNSSPKFTCSAPNPRVMYHRYRRPGPLQRLREKAESDSSKDMLQLRRFLDLLF